MTQTPTRVLLTIATGWADCEMGEEDGCPNPAAYLLEAPGSYVVPLYVCETHAEEERTYFGTVVR